MTTGTVDEGDLEFLREAVALAERGRGRTHPNPVVGCVLVRDGQVVGRGFHAEYGGPHAEVNAIGDAGARTSGSTAYVSLEPCDHEGLTGPCTKALHQAGVTRVVFGARDPGPGRGGAAHLRDMGVRVDGPVLSPREARHRNPAFFRIHGEGRPYVALKLAMSLDGRIARAPGHRTAITGPEAAAHVHGLRREFDGILVGADTARTDDPLLTVRDGAPVPRPPARVILDSGLRLSPRSRLFTEAAPVELFCGMDPPSDRHEALAAAGARVHQVPRTPTGLDLSAVLEELWNLGIRAVLCEGGGRLAASLLSGDLVQRLYLFLSPVVLGSEGVPAFPMAAEELVPGDWTPLTPVETFGPDVLVTWDKEEAPA